LVYPIDAIGVDLLLEIEFDIILNSPDCSLIQLVDWYDESNKVNDMQISLGSIGEAKQASLPLVDNASPSLLDMGWCNINLRVEIEDCE
jgi:hypothetical protein